MHFTHIPANTSDFLVVCIRAHEGSYFTGLRPVVALLHNATSDEYEVVMQAAGELTTAYSDLIRTDDGQEIWGFVANVLIWRGDLNDKHLPEALVQAQVRVMSVEGHLKVYTLGELLDIVAERLGTTHRDVLDQIAHSVLEEYRERFSA